MWRAVWRGLKVRKVRLVLSAVAVMLGVAFVVAAQIFMATLNQTFASIVAGTASEVMVTDGDESMEGSQLSAPEFSEEMIAEVEGLAEVERAEGSVLAEGVYVYVDEEMVGSPMAPTFGFNYHDLPGLYGEGAQLVEGSMPQTVDEVALDPETLDRGDIDIGDEVLVITPYGGQRETTVTGSVTLEAPSFGGATISVFDTESAQRLLGDREGYFHAIDVQAASGYSHQEAAEAIRGVVPDTATVQTGEEYVEEQAEGLSSQLGFLNILLFGFALVALGVGTFLIVNTFAMLIAQRRRELALYRAVGARRGQVQRMVMAEALVLGVLASAVGVLAGIGVALGIIQLFTAIGLDIQAAGLVLQPVSLLLAFGFGVLVTLIAAWVPVRATSGISPVEALQAAEVRRELSWTRVIIGAVLLVLGLGLLGLVLAERSASAAVLGGGVLAVAVALVLISPVLGRPFVAGAGLVWGRLFGRTGSLAALNAQRNPRRTGVTASALMIGLALVTTLSVVAESTRSSVEQLADDTMAADLLVTTPANLTIPPQIAESIADVDGVDEVSAAAMLPLRVAGEDQAFFAEDELGTISPVDVVSGSTDDLDAGSIAVSESRAEELSLSLGDEVEVTSNGRTLSLDVVAIYRSTAITLPSWVGSPELVTAFDWPEQDMFIGLVLDGGAEAETVKDEVSAAAEAFPPAEVYDAEGFGQMRAEQVDQIVGMVYALLVLAVVIALLGVVNTLALSVAERQREMGLLRAVGMRRGTVRNMVRLESVTISLWGAVLGIGAGLLFGVAVQRFSQDQGIMFLAVPWWQLLGYLVLAAVVGVLAAFWPAWRASRTEILTAISGD